MFIDLPRNQYSLTSKPPHHDKVAHHRGGKFIKKQQQHRHINQHHYSSIPFGVGAQGVAPLSYFLTIMDLHTNVVVTRTNVQWIRANWPIPSATLLEMCRGRLSWSSDESYYLYPSSPQCYCHVAVWFFRSASACNTCNMHHVSCIMQYATCPCAKG